MEAQIYMWIVAIIFGGFLLICAAVVIGFIFIPFIAFIAGLFKVNTNSSGYIGQINNSSSISSGSIGGGYDHNDYDNLPPV